MFIFSASRTYRLSIRFKDKDLPTTVGQTVIKSSILKFGEDFDYIRRPLHPVLDRSLVFHCRGSIT